MGLGQQTLPILLYGWEPRAGMGTIASLRRHRQLGEGRSKPKAPSGLASFRPGHIVSGAMVMVGMAITGVHEHLVNNTITRAGGVTFCLFLTYVTVYRDKHCAFLGEVYEIHDYGDLYNPECNSKKIS